MKKKKQTKKQKIASSAISSSWRNFVKLLEDQNSYQYSAAQTPTFESSALDVIKLQVKSIIALMIEETEEHKKYLAKLVTYQLLAKYFKESQKFKNYDDYIRLSPITNIINNSFMIVENITNALVSITKPSDFEKGDEIQSLVESSINDVSESIKSLFCIFVNNLSLCSDEELESFSNINLY